jgi:Lrp/AsnC family transcriptional regulator, leucine-responsive regulatory protein
MAAFKLDEIDQKILECLQENARISNVDLADNVGLSPAPCLRRVAMLEKAGVIKKYVTLVDPFSVNLGLIVFVQVSLDLKRLEAFEKAIMKRPEVTGCYLMAGDADYIMRVVVPDVASFEYLLRDFLTKIEGVHTIRSSFALKEVKFATALPLMSAKKKSAAI